MIAFKKAILGCNINPISQKGIEECSMQSQAYQPLGKKELEWEGKFV
jgi:hypothetical protein